MNHQKSHHSASFAQKLVRKISGTSEVLIILSGKMKIDFYSDKKDFLFSKIVNKNDIIILIKGGHGFKILQNCKFIEVKQGPFFQTKTKKNLMKNFIPVNVPKIFSNEKKFVNHALNTNWISSEGSFVKKFEKKFSEFNKRKYGVAVSNGTAALEIAIKSLNLKKGSEVLIPAFSIISTANAVIKNHLKPILIDCDLDTWNMNINETLNKITKKQRQF